jgi:putative acetyltransferase
MPDDLVFAEERPEDVDAVDRLTIDAFGQPAEARLVQELRRNGSLALSAVARLAGLPIAHVGYSPLGIGGQMTSPPVLALAPVSVAPQHQRRGHGSALIRWSIDRLRERGCPALIVLGEPGYYSRFGFQPASDFRIECPYDVPGEYFMALELRDGGLASTAGLVEYRPEFAAVS